MNGSEPAAAPPADPAAAAPSGDQERRKLTSRAGVVALGTLVSRLLGLGRDQVLAAVFHRSATDAFFVAFTIPNVLRQLLAEGAVQTAVIPVLAEVREREGDAGATRFFAAIRGLSLTLLLVVSVLGVALAPWLVELFAAGYKDTPGLFERTVELTRWTFPYIFFMGTAALGVAALNTHHRFTVTAFAPALLNVAFIVCAVALPGWMGRNFGDPMLAMAVGALLGGCLQVVAQWPSLARIGYLGRPRFEWRHPGVLAVLRRMIPALFGVGVYAIDVTVARRFLSELPVGSQTYFAFAQRLCDFPQGIFVMALQAVTLPSLSRLVARGDHAEVEKTFTFGLRLSLFVGVPATILFVTLAEPIVAAVFQRGAFDATATRETARALMAQGCAVWMVAAVRQLVSVFYALGDTRTPVVVASIDLIAFIVLAYVLRGPFGHVGVGLAVAGASFVQLCLLAWGVKRRLATLELAPILSSLVRTAVPALAAGLLAQQLARVWPVGSDVLRLSRAAAVGVVFGVAFLAGAALLKSSELSFLMQGIARRRAAR